MAWFTHLLFLSFLKLFKCDCLINHQSLEEAWEKKLHRDIKEGYEWYENPNPCNITEVKIKMMLVSFILDSEHDIFTMYSHTSLMWKDERLKWNASDYGGLKRTLFIELNYWVPYVELSNGKGIQDWMDIEQCGLKNTGSIYCHMRIEYSTQCATKMSNWPYDTQKCTLEYSISQSQKNVHLLIQGRRAVISPGETEYGPEFTIVGYHQETNTSDEVQLRITFVLDRNGESLAAIIIFPSILLSILTASSFLMDVNDRNRLLIILFSMFCHCLFLLDIGWEIPKHSADTPTILLFYRSSLIMTLFSVFITVILHKFRDKKSAPSPWISHVQSMVLNSYGKYFIWPRWKTNIDLLTSEDVDVKVVDVWNGFANIMNSVCFFVTAIVYFIMIPVYIPRPQSYLYEENSNSDFITYRDFLAD